MYPHVDQDDTQYNGEVAEYPVPITSSLDNVRGDDRS